QIRGTFSLTGSPHQRETRQRALLPPPRALSKRSSFPSLVHSRALMYDPDFVMGCGSPAGTPSFVSASTITVELKVLVRRMKARSLPSSAIAWFSSAPAPGLVSSRGSPPSDTSVRPRPPPARQNNDPIVAERTHSEP